MVLTEKADLILSNGTFYSHNINMKNIDYVAIKGNKIQALGKKNEMADYIGKDTRVIYYTKDQLIIPGLHDNHIHLIISGVLDRYVNLIETASEKEAVEKITKFAAEIPEEKWVLGVGWCRMAWDRKTFPKKESLDAVLPDRPAFLLDSELHGAWVNSKALKICGIDKNTKDPPFGKIERDESGEPTGYLYETALCLVGRYAFQFETPIVKDLVSRYMKKAVQWGITSVSDMTPYMELQLDYEEVFREMNREGQLPIRVNSAKNLLGNLDSVAESMMQRDLEDNDMYRVSYVKQFVDGVPTNYTGLLIEEYSDKPGERGTMLIGEDILESSVLKAHELGIPVRLHACGDGAVRKSLDVYEKAIKKLGKNGCRHQVEHVEVIAPDDIDRFRELEVIASVQPEHLSSGIPRFENNCYPSRLGPVREKYAWPFKTMKNRGVILAAGSDAPVVEGNPFAGMYSGIARIYPDGKPEKGWNPQEKLTIEDLLEMYTYGCAYGERREDDLGTLETGKLADITVLDRNLLRVTPEEILKTKVLLTIVDGKIVYECEL